MLVIENHLTKEMADFVEDSLLGLPFYFQTATSDFSELGDFQKNIPNVIETPYFVNLLGCQNHGTSANDVRYFIPDNSAFSLGISLLLRFCNPNFFFICTNLHCCNTYVNMLISINNRICYLKKILEIK